MQEGEGGEVREGGEDFGDGEEVEYFEVYEVQGGEGFAGGVAEEGLERYFGDAGEFFQAQVRDAFGDCVEGVFVKLVVSETRNHEFLEGGKPGEDIREYESAETAAFGPSE